MAGAASTEAFPAAPSDLPVCRPRPAEDGRILVQILAVLAAVAVVRIIGRRLWRRFRRP